VALSDEEQRLLAQMEAALAAEDPKLVNALRGTGVRRVHRRRAAAAGVGFFLGLALLVVGITINQEIVSVLVSVLGFVVMVAAAVVAIYSWQHVGGAGADQAQTPDRATSAQGSRAAGDQGFMNKMEERWRKRRDESGF
jgi:high-affinity Fe2+/Pb2+ permease